MRASRDVRTIRRVADTEGRILSRISALLWIVTIAALTVPGAVGGWSLALEAAKASGGGSEEAFHALRSVLASQVEKARLDALGADISNFDFTEALLKLDEIVREHSLTPEEVKG